MVEFKNFMFWLILRSCQLSKLYFAAAIFIKFCLFDVRFFIFCYLEMMFFVYESGIFLPLVQLSRFCSILIKRRIQIFLPKTAAPPRDADSAVIGTTTRKILLAQNVRAGKWAKMGITFKIVNEVDYPQGEQISPS